MILYYLLDERRVQREKKCLFRCVYNHYLPSLGLCSNHLRVRIVVYGARRVVPGTPQVLEDTLAGMTYASKMGFNPISSSSFSEGNRDHDRDALQLKLEVQVNALVIANCGGGLQFHIATFQKTEAVQLS